MRKCETRLIYLGSTGHRGAILGRRQPFCISACAVAFWQCSDAEGKAGGKASPEAQLTGTAKLTALMSVGNTVSNTVSNYDYAIPDMKCAFPLIRKSNKQLLRRRKERTESGKMVTVKRRQICRINGLYRLRSRRRILYFYTDEFIYLAK